MLKKNKLALKLFQAKHFPKTKLIKGAANHLINNKNYQNHNNIRVDMWN